jgi:hypothetical protein
MIGKNTSVALNSVVLPETAGVTLPTFMNLVRKFELSRTQVGLFVEMIESHHVSVPYVGKLLGAGVSLPHVHAAYLLRDKLEPLYDPDNSVGSRTSEFGLPVDKACELMARMFGQEECEDDDSIEAAARLLSDIADRCPQIRTWSTILDVLNDVYTPLQRAIEARVGDLLDLPPSEKVEMMIGVIDELQLIVDRRF